MNRHYYYKTQNKEHNGKIYEKVNHKPIIDIAKGVELMDLGYTVEDLLSYSRIEPFALNNLKQYQANKEFIMSKTKNPIHKKELLNKLALGISIQEIYSEFLQEIKKTTHKVILKLEQGIHYIKQGITIPEILERFNVTNDVLLKLQKFAISLNIIKEEKFVRSTLSNSKKTQVRFAVKMNKSDLFKDPIGWEIRQLFNSNTQLREFAI